MPARSWFITGVAGFIGSNLAEYLLRRGHRVRGLDNFFSGKRRNIARLQQQYPDTFEFVEASILDGPELERAMEACSVVVHLAAQVSVIRSIDDPMETHEINTLGFMRVLQAAASKGASHLVYASSCAVYGASDQLPLDEMSPTRPLSPYAASKLANEAYAQGFQSVFPHLVTVGLRFFNIFGPWQDAAGGYAAVVPRWVDLVRQEQQATIFGDGGATRDFCYVENVCDAIALGSAAEAALSGSVFNVATGKATRLKLLHDLICGAVFPGRQHPPGVTYAPWRRGEIIHSYASVERAASQLGFAARVDLAEGLRRMLAIEYNIEPLAPIAEGGPRT